MHANNEYHINCVNGDVYIYIYSLLLLAPIRVCGVLSIVAVIATAVITYHYYHHHYHYCYYYDCDYYYQVSFLTLLR